MLLGNYESSLIFKLITFVKNGLGYVLGDFRTNHPVTLLMTQINN
jgi:hypothetical protein